MNKSCSYCGRIHPSGMRCPRKPQRNRHEYAKAHEPEHCERSGQRWNDKAKAIKEKSNWLCAVCKDEGIFNGEALEAHHVVKVAMDPDRMYDDSNIICLCSRHHELAERGEIKPKYLLDLIDRRDNEPFKPFIV